MNLPRVKLRRQRHDWPARLGAWLLGAGLVMGLNGCGQKGPLYLPDHKPEAVPAAPATAAPAPAAQAPAAQAPAVPETPAQNPATRKAPAPDPAAQQ